MHPMRLRERREAGGPVRARGGASAGRATVAALLAAGLAAWLAAAAGLPAQDIDYKAEVEEIAKETKLRLNFLEGDSAVFAVSCNLAEGKQISAAVDKAIGVWQEISGSTWQDLWGPKKALFVVCPNRSGYKTFIGWYARKHKDSPYLQWPFEQTATAVTYWPQPIPRVMAACHFKPSDLKDIVSKAVHLTGHLCMLRHKFDNRPIPPWLEEGFGSYLEGRVLGRNNCYCFSGGYGDAAARLDKLTNIEWAKWKAVVAGLANGRQDKAMAQILPLRMTELSADEMGKAWSVIDYLVKKDPKKFVKWVEVMKSYWPRNYNAGWEPAQGEAQEKAMREIFDCDMAELDTAWRAWAKGGMK